MKQWTIGEVYERIEAKAVNGYVSRADLKNIMDHFMCSTEASAIIRKAMGGLTGISQQHFSLSGELADLNQPKAVWSAEQVVSQLVVKTKPVAGSGGVITRNDLLTVAFDSRTPFNIRAKLRGVTEGANAHKMSFYTNDFREAVDK